MNCNEARGFAMCAARACRVADACEQADALNAKMNEAVGSAAVVTESVRAHSHVPVGP